MLTGCKGGKTLWLDEEGCFMCRKKCSADRAVWGDHPQM